VDVSRIVDPEPVYVAGRPIGVTEGELAEFEDAARSIGRDTALVEQARELVRTFKAPLAVRDVLAGLADEVEELRARVAALEAGIGAAADEVVSATGVDDHYLAVDLRALLDAGQHHRDDGCLDEVVRLSADAGLYDQGDET
jgi:hypothetical protein